VIAVVQDARSLAVLGTSGGFLAPILASTGGGSHVMLFSYYAVLNAGILTIAWFKAWRVLNLVGFAFTFAIGTLWGFSVYRPEHFASTEPFLAFFFLLYVAIPILFARRRAPGLERYVDGTLVFGVPLVAFGLQVGLVRELQYGAAWSALALAAVYLVLTRVVFGRRGDGLRLLAEGFLALGVVFLEELGCLEPDEVLPPGELLTGRGHEKGAEEGGGGEEEQGPPSAQPPYSSEARDGAAEKRRHREVLDGPVLARVDPEQRGVVHGQGDADRGENDGHCPSLGFRGRQRDHRALSPVSHEDHGRARRLGGGGGGRRDPDGAVEAHAGSAGGDRGRLSGRRGGCRARVDQRRRLHAGGGGGANLRWGALPQFDGGRHRDGQEDRRAGDEERPQSDSLTTPG